MLVIWPGPYLLILLQMWVRRKFGFEPTVTPSGSFGHSNGWYQTVLSGNLSHILAEFDFVCLN